MSDYQAAKAFKEVFVPVRSNDGDFIADMTLTDNLERHKQQLIENVRAVKSGKTPQDLDIGLSTWHQPEDKIGTLVCRDGMLDSTCIASIAFKKGQELTDEEAVTLAKSILTAKEPKFGPGADPRYGITPL